VQSKFVTREQQRRRWQRVLFGITMACTAITPSVIQTTPESIPGERAQLPIGLRRWDNVEAYSSTEALKALKQGVDDYDSKNYESALEALPPDQDAKVTGIGDYILLYRANSNLMMERYKEALDSFRLLESRFPDSSLISDALSGQCRALLQLKDPKSVLAILDSPKIESNTETLYYRAKALDEAGDKEQAFALYLRIYSEHPTSQYSPLAERGLLALSPGALKGRHSYNLRLQRAEALINAGDDRSARALLVALGRIAAPDSGSSQKRILLLGEVEYHLGRTSTALAHLRKVTAEHPALHARAIYLQGACYRKLGREKDFLAQRDKALKLYPESSETEELCYSAATYFEVNYQAAKAREAYKLLQEVFPKGRRAEAALWKVSLYSYIEKQYSDAALGFWNYLRAFPDPLPASSAMYWMGRCYEKLGDPGKAHYLYRKAEILANDSYYGQRAREADASLQKAENGGSMPVPGLDFKQVVATCDGIQFPQILMPEPDEDGIQVIERARRLVSEDLQDLALSELLWGSRRYPKNEKPLRYIMSRVYASRGDYYESITSLRRAFPDYKCRALSSLPEEVWHVLFPVRHWETIAEQAGRANLDPTLILGIIRQESGFEEKARSSANARGLMQILPSTGRILARQARLRPYNTTKLYHPETNITLGIQHLASLFQRYGETELALSAYNAGESRVKRWLKEYGDGDMAEFVERIPISETRNYVKQVLSNKGYYDLLIPPEASASR
jgi:soluble lytic murein transglycosylase